MKMRLLALVVAIALLLYGYCTCDTQLEQLHQRVTELENQLAAITVTEPSEPAPTEPAPTEPAPTEPAPNQTNDISRTLDGLLQSPRESDWLCVAESEEATLYHLLRCAQKCSSLTNYYDLQYTIADKLVKHPNANEDVVKILCQCQSWDVLYRISYADCNDSSSLIAIAYRCVDITGNATTAYNIADNLLSHPNSTADVAMVLSNSCHTNVKELAHRALESLGNG